jgi:hypothetical protein
MTSQTTVSIACLNWGTFLDTYLFQIYACATFSSANSATWPPARSAWSWRRPSGRHSSALTALGPSLGIPMCPRYPTLWGWWMWMKRTSTPTTLCQVPAVLHEKSVCFACLLAAKKHGLFLVWKPSNGKPPGFKLCVVFFLFFWLTVFYMIWYVYISIIIYIYVCIYLEKKHYPRNCQSEILSFVKFYQHAFEVSETAKNFLPKRRGFSAAPGLLTISCPSCSAHERWQPVHDGMAL